MAELVWPQAPLLVVSPQCVAAPALQEGQQVGLQIQQVVLQLVLQLVLQERSCYQGSQWVARPSPATQA